MIEPTPLQGVFVLAPKRHGDARGFFSETWNALSWANEGLPDVVWVQDNQSLSEDVGTLRGLHYQAPPDAQAKLVRCGAGALWDVVVDARTASPTFGKWFGTELSAANGRQLFVPDGFLHGFVTLQPGTECLYKCSAFYAPEADGAVRWDSVGIKWPLDGDPVLSGKDAAAPAWADWESPF